MLSKVKILKIIQQNTDDIKMYGVRKLGIFGSFANARQTSKSDIDVLVEFNRDNKTFDNYMDLKFYLENLFHRKIDLVMRGSLKTRIKEQILSEIEYA